MGKMAQHNYKNNRHTRKCHDAEKIRLFFSFFFHHKFLYRLFAGSDTLTTYTVYLYIFDLKKRECFSCCFKRIITDVQFILSVHFRIKKTASFSCWLKRIKQRYCSIYLYIFAGSDTLNTYAVCFIYIFAFF